MSETRQTKKGRSKLKNVAGLVGGDSDSSALTQESGDESAVPTASLATGTDVGTDYETMKIWVYGIPQASQKSRESFQER
ncbi:uncharacterized protein LAESUDRAFT_733060 [Laetiporus sulphureus 93-53]|uniref:Uncharacterized protein n=1 Tax=Laetiporus sulphureus 93-53 TaxID=1314785 RepID=A0A165ASI8_9APHY|nr:uncharacterized protein LAESUDRAFT_733060 [Laetiporus sulphureus 93-53]KZS99579.1 hypothetical protein LAESUDRAFT_733060 [Laetiporus sulphureus 93-53]